MEKLFLVLFVVVLMLSMVACSTTPPVANELTVVSCTQESYVDGVHLYRITFSDGSTADFTVNDGYSAVGGGTGSSSSSNFLQLPEQYDLVVGDTFELFYKGISLCLDSDAYAYELSFSDGSSRGNNYTQKYIWTPTESDIGVHKLNILVRDNIGNIVDTGTVKLNVVGKPVSPDEELVFLFVGDSLTTSGLWPSEVVRRLTATDTKVASGVTGPKGNGLTNIKTIGTQKTDKQGIDVFYEGYGGWTFKSYTTSEAVAKRVYFVYINGNYASLNLTQHSFYKDDNGQIWKLEHIDDNKLKLIAVTEVGGNVNTSCKGLNVDSKGNVPSTGKLTLFSGGANDAQTLTYTSVSPAEGNPFWNIDAGKNDFRAYAQKHGVDTIDEVFVNLGWNCTNLSAEDFVKTAKDLIDGILADFPDCHINLIGLQVPSRDGFGTNYGTSWNFYEKTKRIFEFQQALIELSNDEKYGDSISFISVAGQFDSANCYPTASKPINNRVPTKVPVQNNGVHPNDNGIYQIADAVYRHIVTRLQK